MKCGEGKIIDGKPVGCGGDLVPDSPPEFICAMWRCVDCKVLLMDAPKSRSTQ